MQFSVAICTHNGEKYILEQLDSILDQTFPVAEILISDDASTDTTVELIETFMNSRDSSELPSIRLFRNESALGVSRNFQECISLTNNEWVLLCDQDDIWHPDKTKLLLEQILLNPTSKFFFTDAEIVAENGKQLGYSLFKALGVTRRELRYLRSRNCFQVFLRRNIATGATCLVHKDVFRFAVPFPPEWLHDEWLAICAAYEDSIDVYEGKTIDYRQHSSNVIGAKKLTVRRRISKYREPRRERNSHLVRRALVLRNRLGSFSTSGIGTKSAHKKRAIEEYLQFHVARSGTAGNRLLRIFDVCSIAFRMNYFRNSLGLRDFVRDLVQPDR